MELRRNIECQAVMFNYNNWALQCGNTIFMGNNEWVI